MPQKETYRELIDKSVFDSAAKIGVVSIFVEAFAINGMSDVGDD
jgi:hypothetical protein